MDPAAINQSYVNFKSLTDTPSVQSGRFKVGQVLVLANAVSSPDYNNECESNPIIVWPTPHPLSTRSCWSTKKTRQVLIAKRQYNGLTTNRYHMNLLTSRTGNEASLALVLMCIHLGTGPQAWGGSMWHV